MLLLGDFAQLPPVIPKASMLHTEIANGRYTEYLFESKAWACLGLKEIELTLCKRTSHVEFSHILNVLREGVPPDAHMIQRLKALTRDSIEDIKIAIFPRCAQVSAWNQARMDSLPGATTIVEAIDDPTESGFVPTRMLSAVLRLKSDMPIVTLVNQGKYANGTILSLTNLGTEDVKKNDEWVTETVAKATLRTKDGTVENCTIRRFTDEALQPRTADNQERKYGTRKQLPFRPAFGFTVHKCQGKSISEPFVVDCGGVFASGQAYVALSRATDPSLMHLQNLTSASGVYLDERVRAFHQRIRSCELPSFVPEAERLEDMRAYNIDIAMKLELLIDTRVIPGAPAGGH